ncbi:hypothetical protein [Butyrivibrio sp. YAB3001]|uniref:hypothetical protein n=1 Tax=Butyrivibrio sp. YAB3001 TaxID=1520812 RepID=UPI0008F67715|nr:hypothetical protein [Butyrivibrio sp. YAB3001]SFC74941.1 hypothetical protein SAMN02910398_03063 [Butyrivibrio sp. YAB3001]
MITCISYGDRKYYNAAKFNLETAKMHGADRTILYGQKDLPLSFKLKNWCIYYRIHFPGIRPVWRGAGYWIWKSYIILKTLENMNDGDYLLYSDGGSVYVNDIQYLIDVLNRDKLNYMVFTTLQIEKNYSKRDAFILLDADSPEYTDSIQRLGGFWVIKKCAESISFVSEWQKACLDPRIISDSPNKLGKDNYPGFVENRHDQTALSLIAKKHHFPEYRDPSQWGNNTDEWNKEILDRSTYPQIWYCTRNPEIDSMEIFKENVPDPFVNPYEE